MATVRVKPGQFGAVIRSSVRASARALKASAVLAAHRGKSHVVRQGPTDQGQFRNSWEVRRVGDGAELTNTAPHAGIIERGARPHGVNKEGMEALTQWARRKFGLELAEARRVAGAIARKLQREGQKGHYVVRKALPLLERWWRQEMDVALALSFNGGRR